MPFNKPIGLYLPDHYWRMVQEILHRHLAEAEVWVYGSRVNGDCFSASDLDLVVRQPDDLQRRQSNLPAVIEAFSDSNLPIFVQLVDWANIPTEFQAEIAEKYVVVHEAK